MCESINSSLSVSGFTACGNLRQHFFKYLSTGETEYMPIFVRIRKPITNSVLQFSSLTNDKAQERLAMWFCFRYEANYCVPPFTAYNFCVPHFSGYKEKHDVIKFYVLLEFPHVNCFIDVWARM